jgi:hypothetical protein
VELKEQIEKDPLPPITSLMWWLTPEEAWADPMRLLQQVMAIGLPEHVDEARERWSEDDFRQALRTAPPGLFDPRSWAYWHTILGMRPVPPLPERTFPEQ